MTRRRQREENSDVNPGLAGKKTMLLLIDRQKNAAVGSPTAAFLSLYQIYTLVTK